ncbi:MAG TPA: hypothetical protein PKX12_11190 [Spirochaetota bacterium]|nr:hypothetical protein [Spirochaetota bacterium]
MALQNLTTLYNPVSFLRKYPVPFVLVFLLFILFPGCYVLEEEEFQGRAPSIFYVEAFAKNDALYMPSLYPNVTDFEKYENMEPSYTYPASAEIYFLLFMDDDLRDGYFSFKKLTVKELLKNGDVYELSSIYTPAFASISIQQLWGTGYITVPGSSGIYKYVFTVTDNDNNESEPVEVLITVE